MQEYDDRYDICPHCGYPADAKASQAYYLSPGYILNKRYIVGRVLGAGGFGVTYIGWDYLIKRRAQRSGDPDAGTGGADYIRGRAGNTVSGRCQEDH